MSTQIDGEFVGSVIKRTTQPKSTASIRSAIETLELDKAFAVHLGDHTYEMTEKVTAIAVTDLLGGDGGRL